MRPIGSSPQIAGQASRRAARNSSGMTGEPEGSDQVRTAELIAALCLATDLGMAFPFEHGLHTTLIAMRIAEKAGVLRPKDENRLPLTVRVAIADVRNGERNGLDEILSRLHGL